MPKAREDQDRTRSDRRQAILSAAIPLFAQNGFSQTNISDIAGAAGVSHGTIFLYFTNKEELFRSALIEPLSELEPLFQVGHPDERPLTRIRQMVHIQLEAISQRESFVRLTQYVLGQRDRFPELAQLLFDFAGRFCNERLAPVILQGQELGELAPGDPQLIAWSYFSFLNGVSLTMFGLSNCLLDQLAETGLRIFGPLGPLGG